MITFFLSTLPPGKKLCFNVRFEVVVKAKAGERPGKGIFYPLYFVDQSWPLNLNLSLNLNLAYLTGKPG